MDYIPETPVKIEDDLRDHYRKVAEELVDMCYGDLFKWAHELKTTILTNLLCQTFNEGRQYEKDKA